MSEALENLERASQHFAPEILLAGGILIVVAGLTTWLGGLKITPWIAAMIAALAGLTVALVFITPSVISICAMTAVPAGIACFLKKPIVIFAGAAFVLAVGAITGLAPTINDMSLKPPVHPQEQLSVSETGVEIKAEAAFWAETFKKAAKESPGAGFGVGGVCALLLIAGGFVFPRVVAAATCASLGTTMIYVGMIFVLWFKGAQPLASIGSRAALHGTVVPAMIVFGTFTQLVLCPSKAKNTDSKQKHGDE
jgi:hypothetical protein